MIPDLSEIPYYAASWVGTEGGSGLWTVYDQSEGFQPAIALVAADNATEAWEMAEEITDGRLATDGETVVVCLIGGESN